MLQPKRTKFRKQQKGRMKGNAGRGNQLAFGTFGIKSLDSNFLTSRQIEAARIAATRFMKREGSIWIMIFPDKPITKKPLEVRMGKGKGAVEYWAAVVKPGRMLLQEKLSDSRKAFSDLKMAHAITPLENPIQLKGQRRSIARIATELTKREVQ